MAWPRSHLTIKCPYQLTDHILELQNYTNCSGVQLQSALPWNNINKIYKKTNRMMGLFRKNPNNYKQRYPGNATITKHSSPETSKEGERRGIHKATSTPHMKQQRYRQELQLRNRLRTVSKKTAAGMWRDELGALKSVFMRAISPLTH